MGRKLDAEVVKLCEAINACNGLRTYSSCSGHGKGPMQIWLEAKNVRDLYPLLRAIDPRYGREGGAWFLHADCTDLPKRPVVFLLSSFHRHNLAEVSKAADTLAEDIRVVLANKIVCDLFGVGARKPRLTPEHEAC